MWSVLAVFCYLALSGFALLFARAWLNDHSWIGYSHWILGLVALAPYSVYQLRHFWRVRSRSGALHYKLGLCTCLAFLGSALSGAWPEMVRNSTLVSLVHSMTSFAFLIFITSHLVLVVRVFLARRASA